MPGSMDVVVTTIFPPTRGTRALSEGLQRNGGTLWILGDVKGPAEYSLPAARFVPIEEQRQLPFALARKLPERHYGRKNLGYLLAAQTGASFLVETDDDNIPRESFWQAREVERACQVATRTGWCNVYRYFTSEFIWPRGFPLERLQEVGEGLEPGRQTHSAYVQQGLADENPDVDAVYRLTRPLPVSFETAREPVFLSEGVWCPFNSQNTTFFREAFPLLYLPSHCSFRMTDIWRSFVAQRCLWSMGSGVLFHSATVFQERNEHDLLRDFADEVSGYLANAKICALLDGLVLEPGVAPEAVCGNLRLCYEMLVREGILPQEELELVSAWIEDMSALLA